ncbi:unnamed protein product, partial [Meganyctiphanes norvegica]
FQVYDYINFTADMDYKNKEIGSFCIENIQIKNEPEETHEESVDIAMKNKLHSINIDKLDSLSVKKYIKNEYCNEAEIEHELDPQTFLDVEMTVLDQKKSINDKNFFCPFECLMSFETKELRKIHMLRHSKKYRTKCTICNETFHSELSRDMHMHIHSTSKTFKCLHKGCEKEFHHQIYLFRHVQIYHPTKIGIKCTICNAKFNSRSLMDDHMQQHNNDSHYKCSLCSKTFRVETHLTNHWIRVHKNKAMSIYRCQQCSATFIDEAHLNNHVTIHVTQNVDLNNVKVLTHENNIMDHNTKSLTNIKKNINKVENEYERNDLQRVKLKKSIATKLTSLYKCHICNQTFTQKLTLVRHFRTHSNPNIPVLEKNTEEKVLYANKEQEGIEYDSRKRETNTEQKLIQCEIKDSDSVIQRVLQKTAHIVDTEKEDNSYSLPKNITDRDERNQLENSFKREKLENFFRCGLCIAMYGTKRGLMKHISQTHIKQQEEKGYKYIMDLRNNKTRKQKITEEADLQLKEAKCKQYAKKKPRNSPLAFNETIWTIDESSDTTGLILEYKGPNGWRLTNKMRIDSIKSDNYYYSPEGKKFRSVNEIERYCNENGIKHDMWNFVFSMKF